MKVLFIGFGSIASRHYTALLSLQPGAQCWALRSNADSADITGVLNIHKWDEVPQSIDFAIVSTPTFKHSADVKELVERNIPFFLEKPISNSLEGLDELREQIVNKGLQSYVACNLRFLPAMQFLKNEIVSGNKRINEVLVYAGSFLPDWRPAIDFRQNYSANKNMGGGAHLDLFHELDYVCWLFGTPKKYSSIKRSCSSLNIDAVDFASYNFVYPEFVANILLNYYRRPEKREMEIVFDDDVWTLDILKDRIINAEGRVLFEETNFTIKDTYIKQMQYFINSILQKKPLLLNTFEYSLEILKICLAGDEIKK